MLEIIITEDESDIRATMFMPNVDMRQVITLISALNMAAKE